eukprot:g1497.t1
MSLEQKLKDAELAKAELADALKVKEEELEAERRRRRRRVRKDGNGVDEMLQDLAERQQQTLKSPLFVTLTYACTLDGSIAGDSVDEEQVIFSGEQAMIMTHRLRALHDCILVGVGTVLCDNPRLNVRYGIDGISPLPVIIDGSLRTPLDCKLVQRARAAGDCGLIIFTPMVEEWEHERQERLRALSLLPGVVVVEEQRRSAGKVSIRFVLDTLSARGLRSVMVEGGASIISQFWKEGCVDNFIITISSVMLSGVRPVLESGKDVTLTFQRVICLSGNNIIVYGSCS